MLNVKSPLWRIPKWYPFLDKKILLDLKMFHVELSRFSKRINLISQNSQKTADQIHFSDSIEAFLLLKKKKMLITEGPLFDLGSGGGFPGLIFGIMDPNQEVVLVEARRRKSEFLKHVISILKLQNIKVLCQRGESLPSNTVTVALSRGYGSVQKTLMDFQKCIKSEGKYIHFKGQGAMVFSELSNWKTYLLGEYTLPETEKRQALFCSKKI